MQYFKNDWYAVSDLNVLYVLKVDDELNLVERFYFKSPQNHNYVSLDATENYLVLRYSDYNGASRGVTIVSYGDGGFFKESKDNLHYFDVDSRIRSNICLSRLNYKSRLHHNSDGLH